MTKIVASVFEKNNLPSAIFTAFCGGAEIGQAIALDTRIPLVSFTGSTKVFNICTPLPSCATSRFLDFAAGMQGSIRTPRSELILIL